MIMTTTCPAPNALEGIAVAGVTNSTGGLTSINPATAKGIRGDAIEKPWEKE